MRIAILLLFLCGSVNAQTCLTAIEVRKVNDLLDSYEILQEDSLFAVEWQEAYIECQRLRQLEDSQRHDMNQLLDIERTRSAALSAMNERTQRKAKTRARIAWILGGIVAIETFGISVAVAVK